jgi:O-antigen ligase
MTAIAQPRTFGALTPTKDGYRNIIALLMLITISRLHQHFSFLAPLRPAFTLVLLAAFYAMANPRLLSTSYATKTWSAKIITAMAVMACLSTPFGISMGNSGRFVLFEYSKTILFAFLVLFAIRHAGDLLQLLWAVVLAGGGLAYLSLFVFKIRAATNDGFARIQNAYSYDSNDLGFVCVLILVLALLAWQISGPRGKLVATTIMAGLGASIARTGSRGAFLTLVVVGAVLLVLVRGISITKKVAFVVVVLIGLLWAAPPGYWDQMNTMTSPTEDYNWTSETGRKAVFKRGMGYMMQFPIAGLGVDNFPRAEGMLSARAQAREFDPTLPGIKWSAAHNSFLQAGAEMGIPGLIIFCVMVFTPIGLCARLRKRMKGWDEGDEEQRLLYFSALYLPVAFIGFSIGGFFVSFAYLDPIYVLVAFTGGLQLSYQHRLRREAEPGAPAGALNVPFAAPVRRYRGGLPPASPRQPSPLPPPVMLPPRP